MCDIINVFKEWKLESASMTVKKQEWQNSISSVKYTTIIHVPEHGTQQFTSDASILRVADKAWYLLPTNIMKNPWETTCLHHHSGCQLAGYLHQSWQNGFTHIIKSIFIVLLAKTIAHKTGSPVVAMNPRTVG